MRSFVARLVILKRREGHRVFSQMWRSAAPVILAVATCLGSVTGAEAQEKAKFDKFKLVVYIECQTEKDIPRRGSGVIVSDRGAVLTARHVVLGSDGEGVLRDATAAEISKVACWGEIGTGGKKPSLKLTLGRADGQYDAMLLHLPRLPEKDKFDYVRYVRLPSSLDTPDVTAYGVPSQDTQATGEIEPRSGKITATQPKPNGTIPTDMLTVKGMSGGPVIYHADGGLIGIVIGARPEVGLAGDFQVLAAQVISRDLGLIELPKDIADRVEGSPTPPGSATHSCEGNINLVKEYGLGSFKVPDVFCKDWSPNQAFKIKVDISSFCLSGTASPLSPHLAPIATVQIETEGFASPPPREIPVRNKSPRNCSSEGIQLEHAGRANANGYARATVRFSGCVADSDVAQESGVECRATGTWKIFPP